MDEIIVEVTGATNWSAISAGFFHTVARKSDGTLWSWGDNRDGQLGNETRIDRNTPTQEITGATNWSVLAAGEYHTVACKSDGTLWSWGRNTYGQLGNGTKTDSNIPIQEITGATNWSAISAGHYYTIARKSDGTLWSWGDNRDGQLGNGTRIDRNTPTQEITGATNWSAITAGHGHTAAIKSDGTLWSWGWNGHAALGDGTRIDRSIPTQEVTSATNWSAISAGFFHTVARKSDGTLWSWGDNRDGQLGNETRIDRNTPTQEITGATNWSVLAAGEYHTVACKSDGTLWSWGRNTYGQIGDGTIINRNIPIQEVTGATNWNVLAAGEYHTIARKSDGTLWGWGGNAYGQIGDGTTTNRNIPKKI